MLSWIHSTLGQAWGPLRLFDSFFFLAAIGFATSALATWLALPRLWSRLPTDRGRAFAVNAELSVGKPISAGLIFVTGIAGNGNQGDMCQCKVGTYCACKIEPVHGAGQPDVAKNQMRHGFPRHFKAGSCVKSNIEIASHRFQQVTQYVRKILIVFNRKNTHPGFFFIYVSAHIFTV